MTEIIAAIAGIIGTIIVSGFTYFMARRAGIGPYQDTLVSKLKDLVDIQEDEIASLKTDIVNLKTRVDELEKTKDDLEALTVRQALVIDRLNATRVKNKIAQPKISQQESDN